MSCLVYVCLQSVAVGTMMVPPASLIGALLLVLVMIEVADRVWGAGSLPAFGLVYIMGALAAVLAWSLVTAQLERESYRPELPVLVPSLLLAGPFACLVYWYWLHYRRHY